MAPRVGLEPTTERLTAASSTIELPRCLKSFLQLRNQFIQNLQHESAVLSLCVVSVQKLILHLFNCFKAITGPFTR